MKVMIVKIETEALSDTSYVSLLIQVLLIVSLLLTNSFAQRTWLKLEVAKPVLKPISVASPNDECSFCIDFATQALNQLLNIILSLSLIHI